MNKRHKPIKAQFGKHRKTPDMQKPNKNEGRKSLPPVERVSTATS